MPPLLSRPPSDHHDRDGTSSPVAEAAASAVNVDLDDDTDVLAQENAELEGWEAARPAFSVSTLLEFVAIDLFYPFSTAFVLLRWGRAAAVNLRHFPDKVRFDTLLVLVITVMTICPQAALVVWFVTAPSAANESGSDGVVWSTLRYEIACLAFMTVYGKLVPNCKWAWTPPPLFAQRMRVIATSAELKLFDFATGWASGIVFRREVQLSAWRLGYRDAGAVCFALLPRQHSLLHHYLTARARAALDGAEFVPPKQAINPLELVANEAPPPDEPSKIAPASSPLRRVSVADLSVALLFEGTDVATQTFQGLKRLKVVVPLAIAAMPIIMRASFGLPVVGTTIATRFIAITCLLWNLLTVVVTVFYFRLAVIDFAMRMHALRQLGELAKRRFEEEAVPAARPGDDEASHVVGPPPRVLPPVLALDSVEAVRAWMLTRRILSRAGSIFNVSVQVITTTGLAFGLIFAAAVFTQLYLSTDISITGSGSSLLGILIGVVFVVALLATLTVYVLLMLYYGARANGLVDEHRVLLMSKQSEAERTAALLRARGELALALHAEGVARVLAVAAATLAFEEPLRLLGLPASDALLSLVMSSIVTAQVSLFGLLSSKFAGATVT